MKTFLTEFVAYQRLSGYIRNRLNGTGVGISLHSEAIATYALCGFANIGGMGMQLGALGAMIPERRGILAQCVLRALVAGTLACFMTACIAGLLFDDSHYINKSNATLHTP